MDLEAIHWGVSNLPVSTSQRGVTLLPHQQPLSANSSIVKSKGLCVCVCVGEHASIHAELVTGLTLCRSCSDNHSCWELMCVTARACAEVSISQRFSVSTSSSAIFPEQGMGEDQYG